MALVVTDIVLACMDLAERSGAADFELGYLHEDVPTDQAGWYAHVQFRGARITVEDQRSPSSAALALAERLLWQATCKCGQRVTLTDEEPGCRWRLVGDRWTPGCTAPPIPIEGRRGDLTAMTAAMAAAQPPLNREQRRAQQHKRPPYTGGHYERQRHGFKQ